MNVNDMNTLIRQRLQHRNDKNHSIPHLSRCHMCGKVPECSARPQCRFLWSGPDVPDFPFLLPTTNMPPPILRDLTIGVLGIQVPKGGGTITWIYGHTTVLLAISDKTNMNKYDAVDILIIRFIARLPSSDRQSKYVKHLTSNVLKSKDATRLITN